MLVIAAIHAMRPRSSDSAYNESSTLVYCFLFNVRYRGGRSYCKTLDWTKVSLSSYAQTVGYVNYTVFFCDTFDAFRHSRLFLNLSNVPLYVCISSCSLVPDSSTLTQGIGCFLPLLATLYRSAPSWRGFPLDLFFPSLMLARHLSQMGFVVKIPNIYSIVAL